MLKQSNISSFKHFHLSFSYLKTALTKHFWHCVFIDEISINPCSDVLIIVKKFQTGFIFSLLYTEIIEETLKMLHNKKSTNSL